GLGILSVQRGRDGRRPTARREPAHRNVIPGRPPAHAHPVTHLHRFRRLARAPFNSTLPPSTACAARARVLKTRAAHNHVSSRTAYSAFSFQPSAIEASHQAFVPLGPPPSSIAHVPTHRAVADRPIGADDTPVRWPSLERCPGTARTRPRFGGHIPRQH